MNLDVGGANYRTRHLCGAFLLALHRMGADLTIGEHDDEETTCYSTHRSIINGRKVGLSWHIHLVTGDDPELYIMYGSITDNDAVLIQIDPNEGGNKPNVSIKTPGQFVHAAVLGVFAMVMSVAYLDEYTEDEMAWMTEALRVGPAEITRRERESEREDDGPAVSGPVGVRGALTQSRRKGGFDC